MKSMDLIDFLLGIYTSLFDLAGAVMDALYTSYTFDGQSYYLYELIFGAGFAVVIVYIIVTWILNLVT